MDEIKIVQYKGRDIIVIDYSKCGTDVEKVLVVIDELAKVLTQMPVNSALTVTNVQSFSFNTEIINKFKETLVITRDHIKKQAVIGINDSVRKFLYHTITRFAGVNIPAFDSETEAMEWLAS